MALAPDRRKAVDPTSGQLPPADVVNHSRRNPLGSNFPDPLLLICFALAVIGAATASVQLTVVGVLVLALSMFSRLWCRLSLERVSIHRQFSTRQVFAGDTLDVEVVIENGKPLPLPWLRLSFLLPDGLVSRDTSGPRTFEGGISFYKTFSLARYERVRATRQIVAGRRGCYRMQAAHMESGDLFGFYTNRQDTAPSADELVVYPVPRPLPGFVFPTRIPDGEARSPKREHEDYSRPNGLREYRPGDPLNRIDWKSTARLGEPFVRTFDPSYGHKILILVECATSEQLWRFRPERLEAAIAAAASACVFGIESGHQVGLIANGLPVGSAIQGGRPVVPPGAGNRQLHILMHSLARVQPMPTWELSDMLLAHATPTVGALSRFTLIYVTALFRDATLELIDRECRRGASAACLYVGPRFDSGSGPGEHVIPPQMPVYDYTELFAPKSPNPVPRDSVMYA